MQGLTQKPPSLTLTFALLEAVVIALFYLRWSFPHPEGWSFQASTRHFVIMTRYTLLRTILLPKVRPRAAVLVPGLATQELITTVSARVSVERVTTPIFTSHHGQAGNPALLQGQW